jgi:hypothetical protein
MRSLPLVVALSGCLAEVEELAPSQPESPPIEELAATLTPMRQEARLAANHMINYGGWDSAEIALAQRHDVVVAYAGNASPTRAQIAAIQTGGDHRVIVLCYLSIGEDLRTASLDDEEMAGDPRFVGDGTGPRIDPRGPFADGQPLAGIDPRGLPSNGGTGWASYYLDDVSVRNDPGHVGDGVPDRNGNFGSRFANMGDPAWFATLDTMTHAADRVSGIRELLTTTYGRGLGCDGLFLDTIDTAAPNSWTDADSSNETKYEWTAPGLVSFLGRLRAAYPDAVIAQNRGLFYFHPHLPHFQFIPRGTLDFVVYESFRLNSSATDNPHPYHYPNNRYNYAPKLLAEADRSDGFRVLSVGYAEGPADQMSERTLVGESTLGFDSLLEDIRVTERVTGMRHYLTDASLTLVNRFVEYHADRTDAEPPRWTSSWMDRSSYPETPVEPTPRVGIQQAVAGPGNLTVRWDVAMDLNRVGYAVYYQTAPFDFAADPELDGATRVILDGRPTGAYAGGVGPGIYAHEATVTGLEPGRTYYLVVRAFDDAAVANEDDNQVVMTAAPTGAPPYLGRLRASNDPTTITFRAQYTESWSWRRVYVDADRVSGTGWSAYGIGADFLIEEGRLFRYAGSGTSWSWTYLKPVTMTSGPIDGMSYVRWQLPLADLGATRHTQVVFQVQRSGATRTAPSREHRYTTTDPSSPISGYWADNDTARLYLHADVGAPFSWKHVFIDDDASADTGYAIGGIGAGYLIENGNLYRHVGPGWTWARVGSATMVVAGASHDWTVARADLGVAGGAPRFTLVFQANGGGPPSHVAPEYEHPFTD